MKFNVEEYFNEHKTRCKENGRCTRCWHNGKMSCSPMIEYEQVTTCYGFPTGDAFPKGCSCNYTPLSFKIQSLSITCTVE